MPTPDFAPSLERRASGTTVLTLAGELDLYRVPEIERALAEAIEPVAHQNNGSSARPPAGIRHAANGAHRLVVDLQAVTFLDSTTLGLLLAASKHQHARGGKLLVLVGPQTPTTAFEVTGFDRLIELKQAADTSGSVA